MQIIQIPIYECTAVLLIKTDSMNIYSKFAFVYGVKESSCQCLHCLKMLETFTEFKFETFEFLLFFIHHSFFVVDLIANATNFNAFSGRIVTEH